MPQLVRATASDLPELVAFLRLADLTLAGLDAPGVRLWIVRDDTGRIVGSTGFERSGEHALIRSVAVHPDARRSRHGTALARAALDEAAAEGVARAWLFSRRSGPFWQSLGFEPADRTALAAALHDTEQVRLFVQTGQLERETAWSRRLP
ncbi:hypothetical protein GCM10025760_14170 [Microbacterium yannicii]|uniref:N-acetyltransferase domain-containing protein n=1 Tax=Microbacterium yannicii TaxID=671622 RepID=A0ABP9M5W0_9MICO|nr:GNAT family N-acetyltransferase [Microbacterium yannicii]MCO5954852.1 GNAT family N-acetyltransferase [Microbacterium yannicii]